MTRHNAELLSQVFGLGERFAGVDIKFRRDASFRPSDSGPRECWEITLHASDKERAIYRIRVTGRTVDEAAERLIAAVAEVDAKG